MVYDELLAPIYLTYPSGRLPTRHVTVLFKPLNASRAPPLPTHNPTTGATLARGTAQRSASRQALQLSVYDAIVREQTVSGSSRD